MVRIIKEDDWIEGYHPKPAPRPGSGFDFGNGCTLVDGKGPGDATYLDAADDRTIWTVVDDGENTAITPGRHSVNRLGYIVTEKAWDDDIDEVEMDD